jgi:hypothetical protein
MRKEADRRSRALGLRSRKAPSERELLARLPSHEESIKTVYGCASDEAGMPPASST